MSPRMPAIACPESTASMSARCSAFSSIRRANFSRHLARSRIGTRPHSANPFLAAATALSTSFGPANGNSASFSPVDGLTVSNRRPSAASDHSPPIKSPFGEKFRLGVLILVLVVTVIRFLTCPWPLRHDGGAQHFAFGRLLEGGAEFGERKFGID